jgi:hypothetical protein
MAPNDSDLGEKALSKVAEVGIASQLNEAEDINVDIRTNPGKLVQGKLDSVSISGKGLVMKQDLRMETLEVSIDEVEINPLKAVFGNIELVHPTDAEAQIVLNEADINRALSSDYIRDKLHNLQMDMDGRSVSVDVQASTVSLPGENKFVITADFLIEGQAAVKKLSATAIPQIQENGHCISLEILSTEGQGLTSELVVVILDQLTNLLDLRNFDMPGMSLQMHQLEAQAGKLVIHAKTQIEQIPAA